MWGRNGNITEDIYCLVASENFELYIKKKMCLRLWPKSWLSSEVTPQPQQRRKYKVRKQEVKDAQDAKSAKSAELLTRKKLRQQEIQSSWLRFCFSLE